MKTKIIKSTSKYEEDVHSFLTQMKALKWTKESQRLEKTLVHILESNAPEDMCIMKLYVEMARLWSCTSDAAERSLRNAVQKMWRENPVKCSALFYRTTEIQECPSVSEFLNLFYAAYRYGKIRSWIDLTEAQILSIYEIYALNRYSCVKKRTAGLAA